MTAGLELASYTLSPELPQIQHAVGSKIVLEFRHERFIMITACPL
jgi:hypothetical protein